MNCQECLSELATGSLRDLTPESEVVRHCTSCPDCGPLMTQLRDREYTAATVLNMLPPMSNPISVAETAGMLARRRRVGKIVVFLSSAALVATVWISLFVTGIGRTMLGIGPGSPPLQTETIHLSCLSPQQAGDIISPFIRAEHSTYYAGESGLPMITVRATPDEIAKSRALIQEFEADPKAACRHTLADKIREIQEQVREAHEDAGSAEPAAPAAPAASARPKK